MEPHAFGVEIDEGDTTTGHRVIVPPTFWDDRGLAPSEEDVAVRESMHFLLERQPATAIPDELSLDDLARDHDDFLDELQRRLSP